MTINGELTLFRFFFHFCVFKLRFKILCRKRNNEASDQGVVRYISDGLLIEFKDVDHLNWTESHTFQV